MLSRSESFAKLDCLLLPGGDSLSFPAENKQRADNQSDLASPWLGLHHTPSPILYSGKPEIHFYHHSNNPWSSTLFANPQNKP